MDFTTTEASDDLGGLVRTITESVCTNEHQRELDSADTRFDRDLWAKLIEAAGRHAQVEWIWVRGNTLNGWTKKADALSHAAARVTGSAAIGLTNEERT